MIKIIKDTIISFSWKHLFDNINKIDFTNFLNYLKTLNVWELFKLERLIISKRLTDNNILKPILEPFQIDFSLVVNTLPKKIFLFGFIFTLIVNV